MPDIVLWSAKHDSKSYVRRRKEFVARLSRSPVQVSEEVKALVRNGGCIFLRARNEQDGKRVLSRRTNDMHTPPATGAANSGADVRTEPDGSKGLAAVAQRSAFRV